MFKPGPNEPNCTEMIRYLVANGDYSSYTKEDLIGDRMLGIVASACNMTEEEVADKCLEILKEPLRNMYKYQK